jgi:hypothetical protein
MWLTPGQARAARRLVRAMLAGTPDVPAGPVARLFAGHPAWGTLAVPGVSPGTVRAAVPRWDPNA